MSDPLILVARVAGAFGVRGELRITTFTEEPMALMAYRGLVREDGSPGLTLSGGRAVKGGIIARAKEVTDRDQAEAMRGLTLFIPRSALPEPDEDEFYLTDLIGLDVQTPDGQAMGKVRTVQDFGAGDLLEIQPDGAASWWLPFTRENVPQVMIARRLIVAIRPPEVEAEA